MIIISLRRIFYADRSSLSIHVALKPVTNGETFPGDFWEQKSIGWTEVVPSLRMSRPRNTSPGAKHCVHEFTDIRGLGILLQLWYWFFLTRLPLRLKRLDQPRARPNILILSATRRRECLHFYSRCQRALTCTIISRGPSMRSLTFNGPPTVVIV